MNEELQFILDSTKEAMINAIKHLEKQLLNIRAGKASPSMLGSVMVDYYGSQTPLSQVANVNTPDGRTITVAPWEKNMLQEIERAIMIANIGFNPMNNGETIIINVPPLTEERRRDLAKQAKSEVEDAKIGIRNARKDANNEIKKLDEISEDLKKNAEVDIQAIMQQLQEEDTALQQTAGYEKKVWLDYTNKRKCFKYTINNLNKHSIINDESYYKLMNLVSHYGGISCLNIFTNLISPPYNSDRFSNFGASASQGGHSVE